MFVFQPSHVYCPAKVFHFVYYDRRGVAVRVSNRLTSPRKNIKKKWLHKRSCLWARLKPPPVSLIWSSEEYSFSHSALFDRMTGTHSCLGQRERHCKKLSVTPSNTAHCHETWDWFNLFFLCMNSIVHWSQSHLRYMYLV